MACFNVKIECIKKPLNVKIQRFDNIVVDTNGLLTPLKVVINNIVILSNISCHKVCATNKNVT